MSSYNPKGTFDRNTSVGMVKVLIIAIVVSFLLPKVIKWMSGLTFVMRVVSWQAQGVLEKLNMSLGYFTGYFDIDALMTGTSPLEMLNNYTGQMADFWAEGMRVIGEVMGLIGGA